MPTAPGTVPINPVINRSRFCRRFAGGASSHTRQAASRAARHLIVLPPVKEAASDGSLPRPTGTRGLPVDHLTSGKCQKRCASTTAKGADRSAGSQVRGVDLELREQRGLVPQGPAGRDEGELDGDDGDREDLGPAAGRGDSRQSPGSSRSCVKPTAWAARRWPGRRGWLSRSAVRELCPGHVRAPHPGPEFSPRAQSATAATARATGSFGGCTQTDLLSRAKGRTRAESASAISGLPRDPQPPPTALSTRHAHLHPAPAPRRPRRTPSTINYPVTDSGIPRAYQSLRAHRGDSVQV